MAGMQIDPSGLDPRDAYRLMISVIVPRPIAWVSTVSPDGATNAAPFSYFQALGGKPPMVMIAVGDRRTGEHKDTRRNIEATGEFVINMVGEREGPAMVKTSIDHPYGVSEFDEAGLTALPSELIKAPRIGGCGVSLECKLDRVLEIAGSGICIGEVVLFHVEDALLDENGVVDPLRLNPLGRLGGSGYATLRETISIDSTGATQTTWSAKLDLWRELRERSIAMVNALSVEQLAAGSGRIFLELAGQEGEWDSSWSADRLASELAGQHAPQDDLHARIRAEAWYQGQAALIHRDDFPGADLWRA